MLSLDIKINIPNFAQLFPEWARQRAMMRLGLFALAKIKARTSCGIDVDGKPFEPYSPAYGKAKEGSGRSRTVNLSSSGAMMASFHVLGATPGAVGLGFEGSAAPVIFSRFRTKSGRLTTRKSQRWGETKVGGITRRRRQVLTHQGHKGSVNVSNALKAMWNDEGQGKNKRRHFLGLNAAEKGVAITDLVSFLVANRRGR